MEAIIATHNDDYDDEPSMPEPEFEVYWFDETTGSERIATFATAEAAAKFGRSLPSHMMAHW